MRPRPMSAERRTTPSNRLLASLPRRDGVRLLAACDPVELELGAVLFEPRARISDVYFPTASVVSLLLPVDGKRQFGIGMVGNEGMVGVPLILGVDCSGLRALVQAAGPALQISAGAFARVLEESPGLRSTLHRYLQVRMTQVAQAAACTRFHLIEGRLARWLLMTEDRAHSHEFHVTHQVLARMLGVRRVGITRAANDLQRRNLIHYHRGEVTILDRPAMKAAACSCYRADLRAYKDLLGGS